MLKRKTPTHRPFNRISRVLSFGDNIPACPRSGIPASVTIGVPDQLGVSCAAIRPDPVTRAGYKNPTKNEVTTMALIAAGASAPDFKLDSHLDSTVSLSEFQGSKNVLLVSYPLDFTPT
jgi:hypothetical protein